MNGAKERAGTARKKERGIEENRREEERWMDEEGRCESEDEKSEDGEVRIPERGWRSSKKISIREERGKSRVEGSRRDNGGLGSSAFLTNLY